MNFVVFFALFFTFLVAAQDDERPIPKPKPRVVQVSPVGGTCGPGAGKICQPGLICPMSNGANAGHCTKRPQKPTDVGAKCGGEKDKQCAEGLECQASKCLPLSKRGELCGGTSGKKCESSLVCLKRRPSDKSLTCMPRPVVKEGGICAPGYECSPELLCFKNEPEDSMGVCVKVAKALPREVCAGSTTAKCVDGFVCKKKKDGSEDSICVNSIEPSEEGNICNGPELVDCKPGLQCVQVEGDLLGICKKPTFIPPVSDDAAPSAPAGAKCGSARRIVCATGLDCVKKKPTDNEGVCSKKLAGRGERCTKTTDCQTSLECTKNICALKLSKLGEQCTNDENCKEGLFCSIEGASPTGVCQPEQSLAPVLSNLGEACSAEKKCAAGLVCKFVALQRGYRCGGTRVK